eukprot:CAMPEP_0185831364 /NCGR_PEP_ID=MMETSP1353-20130828/1447_1 /TAXON_ID=1077150 /ORGANISM="Erythrolobus australicus, Strain CCMP3124" /LENGTH=232 /DNA_ID=CAMNT_0028529417 /DNA_START=578 /DNA_END=1274 /DNA_ORIENTATION=-
MPLSASVTPVARFAVTAASADVVITLSPVEASAALAPSVASSLPAQYASLLSSSLDPVWIAPLPSSYGRAQAPPPAAARFSECRAAAAAAPDPAFPTAAALRAVRALCSAPQNSGAPPPPPPPQASRLLLSPAAKPQARPSTSALAFPLLPQLHPHLHPHPHRISPPAPSPPTCAPLVDTDFPSSPQRTLHTCPHTRSLSLIPACANRRLAHAQVQRHQIPVPLRLSGVPVV